jgi:transcriptional regulator with XRE-family HTH domain
MADTELFSREVGLRLRAVRRQRGLTLDDVERASDGRWSASAVGAYERGFRNLSLPRLRELADFYGVPMSLLLGEPKHPVEPDSPGRVVLDLTALEDQPDAAAVQRYANAILMERGDWNGRVLSIRRDDVRALCAVMQVPEERLVERLRQWGALAIGGPLVSAGARAAGE